MQLHNLTQGSDAWHLFRLNHHGASEASAMLGISPLTTRTQLLAIKKTGIGKEFSQFVQECILDKGHEVEAMARPIVEELIGDDLFPVTCSNGMLSASCDGLTMDRVTAFEHKQWAEDLAAQVRAGTVPEHHMAQCQQILMVTGAHRVVFAVSDGTREKMVHTIVEPILEWWGRIRAGWEQFDKDLAEFTPVAAEVKPTGKAPESLPALHIVIQGGVSASNLDEFKETALGAIRSVNRELTTDVQFADAEKAVKWCSDIEDRIKAAKDHALSQTASIDALFRTMDEISAEARRVRLDLDKLVKARKEAVKGELVAAGVAAMAKHIRELNAAMPADYMPQVPADFGGCIKGLRTVDSIRNAVDTELARVKIMANEIANRIHANVKTLKDSGLVVHDAAALVLKQPDDLAAVIAQRVAAEKAKEEAQRERIRAEEAARLEREAKAEADRIEKRERMLAEEVARQEHQRAHAAQVEAQRIAREQAEAASAERIRDELIASARAPLTAEEAYTSRGMTGTNPLTPQQCANRILSAVLPEVKPADDGDRLTLGQINERIAPVSITVAGLSLLGYEPVEQVKASRLYRASDFRHICAAISAHVLAAPVSVNTKLREIAAEEGVE